MRKVGVVLVVLVLGLPLAWATPPEEPAPPCAEVRWDNGVALCRISDGHYEMFDAEGNSLGFTHGSDPISLLDGESPISSTSSGAVECVTGAAGSYYIRVIYARAYNDADNYASSVATIRNLVSGAQQLVNDAALATAGGTASMKVRCVDGLVSVDNAVLDTAKSSANYNTIFADLEQLGYTDPKVKYWVWYDDTAACSCAGIGHIYYDDSPGVGNYNNGNGDTMFAVTFGYNSVRTMLHELGHNLGAVQKSAPYTTGAGHCIDGRDTMCYNDGGPNGGSYSTSYCSVEVFDCGRNDYFHLAPASGSYLATKWNLGHTNNRYMRITVNVAPTMTGLNCSPTNAVQGDPVTCDFTATDTSDNVAYDLQWGDGATERIPSSGFVASGTTRSATHTYSTAGGYTVRVSATDDNSTAPLSSSALTRSISVQAAPVMQSLSCAPSPSEPTLGVSCSFRADDGSTGVYYEVDWGDGTPLTRMPSAGYSAPGQSLATSHAWSAVGTYTVSVTATDNGVPPLASAPMTTSMTIEPNAAPSMTSLSCSPNPVQAENPTTCSFSASDRSSLYYLVDWGDGSPAQRVPASGTVQPGTTQQASRTFMTDEDRVVSVTATDAGSPALTSSAVTTDLAITPPNVAPTMASASCNLVGATSPTTCTFRATDSDSTGVKYRVEWGDGLVDTVPATGYSTPGNNAQRGHVYPRAGTYLLNVTATDNGSPAKTSGSIQISVTVSADSAGPALTIQDPFPKRLYYGCAVQRDILAGDAVYLQRGCVRATASDVSGVANITVLVNGELAAIDSSAPYVLDFALPYTGPDAMVTVIATDNLGNKRIANLQVDLI